MDRVDTRRSIRSRLRRRAPALAVAMLAGMVVYLIAHLVFPHHSINHDEAVYLQQAEMLLAGRLTLTPPVQDVFHPWFFVSDGQHLYPKYTPVPAAMFAVGMVLGDARLALAAVAAGICYLTVAIGAELFDRRTGVLAGVLLLASPLFLVDAALFLPYAPTTLLNLMFALAYVRADRTGRHRWAVLGGLAIGLAFFARPFTAVLFAIPFVVHAIWTVRTLDTPVIVRQFLIGTTGMAGVVLALAYNAHLTGSALLFPYEAFAPQDGLGFGRRAILGYERMYTPSLAVRANLKVLASYSSRWIVAGPVGALLAAVGLWGVARRGLRSRLSGGSSGADTSPAMHAHRLVVAGLFFTLPAGNILFWGNLNILGRLSVQGDGLIRFLGPYYHFDLLAPTAIFAAVGSIAVFGHLRSVPVGTVRPRLAARVGLAASVLVAATFVGIAGAAVAPPLADNHENSRELSMAYEPFDRGPPADAVVFLPTPLGDWLNHPFQKLRNDPGFDGRTIYAIDERQFAVVDAYPDRRLYRYVYRGQWAPMAGDSVQARLQPVRHVAGESVRMALSVGIPHNGSVSIRMTTGRDHAHYTIEEPGRSVNSTVTVTPTRAHLRGQSVTPLNPGQSGVAPPENGVITLTVFVDYGRGSGFSYQVHLPVATETQHVRGLTPELEVCQTARRCGGEAAYIPETARPGVYARANLTTGTRGR